MLLINIFEAKERGNLKTHDLDGNVNNGNYRATIDFHLRLQTGIRLRVRIKMFALYLRQFKISKIKIVL